MVVTVYLYHNVIPKREINLFRCIKCGRPMFKYTADEIVVANIGLTNFESFPVAAHYSNEMLY